MDDSTIRLRVAAKLQEQRKKKGYTLADVGSQLGISPSQLSRIENGNQDVSVVE